MNEVLAPNTELAIRKIISKIEEERVSTKFNFNEFIKKNSSLQKFLINYQMQNLFFQLDLTEENYQIILKYLTKVYNPPKKTKERRLINIKNILFYIKNIFKNITTKEKIDTFIDAITLAFIAGSIYGLGIISIYSTIN